MDQDTTGLIWDPIKFAEQYWPHITFYNKQQEIIYSVINNDETVVPAGNALGKDFVSAFIVLWFFLSRHPCRIITTSVDHDQLHGVLWGEIRRFLQEANDKFPLVVNDLMLRKIVQGKIDGLSYVRGRVAAKGEGLSGHHIAATGDKIPRTLAVIDEASGVDNESFEHVDEWADRKLIIGNTNPCDNYFYRSVKRGDIKAPTNGKYFTKIIQIKAQDSPNVRYAEAQIAKGKEPSFDVIIPGVKTYDRYLKHRQTMDPIMQCIKLDAEFYEGSEVKLYPPEWLQHSQELHSKIKGKRAGRTLGVDTGEGSDDTCWAIVDDKGLIHLEGQKTPDTSVIPNVTLGLMKEYNIRAENVLFDHGGGGKQHADYLRAKGFNVRSVSFGGAPRDINRFKKMKTKKDRQESEEEKDIYKNRRAEMYGILRNLMNPSNGGFSIPPENTSSSVKELIRQLRIFNLQYDQDGKMFLPPKRNLDPKSKKETIISLLGCSPDETDSLVLATYGLVVKPTIKKAGVI